MNHVNQGVKEKILPFKGLVLLITNCERVYEARRKGRSKKRRKTIRIILLIKKTLKGKFCTKKVIKSFP